MNDQAKGAPQFKLTELNGGKTWQVERSGEPESVRIL
jgi:hypothetical protein